MRLPDTLARPAARLARSLFLTAAVPVLLLPARAAEPTAPPGFNVHLVHSTARGRFWRGGAPRRDTLAALASSARARGVQVTLVDLRKPANRDDQSGKAGRLSPAGEAKAARELGFHYLSISALDRKLPDRLNEAMARGDIYMHCMYGVNRTGFAAARYARALKVKVPAQGLGKRDWAQGDRFQRSIEGK
jgi:hypothetical protein